MFEFDDRHVARSIPDAIALLLEKLVERGETVRGRPREGGAICPECNSPMEMISGCAYCFSCGYSPCKEGPPRKVGAEGGGEGNLGGPERRFMLY